MDTRELNGNPVSSLMERILYEVKKIVVGQDHFLERVLVAILAQGHLLVEGVPGLAKTLTVKTLARTIRGSFKRIQFTPDLVPADLVGTRIYNQKTGDFATSLGPVFTNLLLADEINRAPAKVQSALLEVMQEYQVTIAGETHHVHEPFLVMATQNPIEYEGTFPLPEAQLDRFFVRTTLGYPDAADEARIVEEQLGGHPLGRLRPAIDLAEVAVLRRSVASVFVHEAVAGWIVDLARATRGLDLVAIGSSVRGTLALNRAARAWAVLHSRRYVTPEDVEQLFVPVLMHRILFRPSFLAELRDRGWEAASLEVRARCLEVAPKPGFDIDLDVPAAASG